MGDAGDLTAIPSESIAYQSKSGVPLHWAVLVGISDYKAISDLSFCEEDVNDWYAYLVGLGHEYIILLGDDTSVYTQYDGLATEFNVKQALLYVVANAAPEDTVVFMSPGHGSGDSRGQVYSAYGPSP